MPAGHEVDEDVIAPFHGSEFVEKVTFRPTSLSNTVHVQFGRKDGTAAAAFEEDSVILDASHMRVPPQTGQVDRPEHVTFPPGVSTHLR